MRLYNLWRRQFCDFLGIPFGPNGSGGEASGGGVSLVV
jgi:hypothetical protein